MMHVEMIWSVMEQDQDNPKRLIEPVYFDPKTRSTSLARALAITGALMLHGSLSTGLYAQSLPQTTTPQPADKVAPQRQAKPTSFQLGPWQMIKGVQVNTSPRQWSAVVLRYGQHTIHAKGATYRNKALELQGMLRIYLAPDNTPKQVIAAPTGKLSLNGTVYANSLIRAKTKRLAIWHHPKWHISAKQISVSFVENTSSKTTTKTVRVDLHQVASKRAR